MYVCTRGRVCADADSQRACVGVRVYVVTMGASTLTYMVLVFTPIQEYVLMRILLMPLYGVFRWLYYGAS